MRAVRSRNSYGLPTTQLDAALVAGSFDEPPGRRSRSVFPFRNNSRPDLGVSHQVGSFAIDPKSRIDPAEIGYQRIQKFVQRQ